MAPSSGNSYHDPEASTPLLIERTPTDKLFGGIDWFRGHTPKKGPELEREIQEMAAIVRKALDQSIQLLTPWFFDNLPRFYFLTTPKEDMIRDLHALITGRVFDGKQKLQLWNREGNKTTFLAPGNDPRQVLEIANNASDLPLRYGALFRSKDNLLLIGSFGIGEYQAVVLEEEDIKNTHQATREILLTEGCDALQIDSFLSQMNHEVMRHGNPTHLARLYKLAHALEHREDAVSHLISHYGEDKARYDIAFKKMPLGDTLPSLIGIMNRYGFQIQRAMFTEVRTPAGEPVSIFTFIVAHEDNLVIDETFIPYLRMNKAAKTLQWVDNDAYHVFFSQTEDESLRISLNEANLLRAMGTWVQIFLSKQNPYYYGEERVLKCFHKHFPTLIYALDRFKAKFNPQFQGSREEEWNRLQEAFVQALATVENEIERDILQEVDRFLNHLLKTNYFLPSKTGLAFRMDPGCLNPEHYPQAPFGFFFFVGRGYRGFQVRFKDTARGGLRLVMPKDNSQFEASLAGLFDEVYGLAFAQQQKNKDIPEGGSKAVLLLNPGADREAAAIGAVDSLLNLITTNPATGTLPPSIVDHYGKDEFIYLGPDENVTNALIEKFVALAHQQGYRYPNAFMSSKPKNGINHKIYGVTSEGVNVFMKNMLEELHIDPYQQDFTLKLTGGPDGDVAGNALKIMHREFGHHAKVVAIADGFGAAYDPNGLDWPELLRLVAEELPINHFDTKKLSPGKDAYVITADTAEHIRTRNELYATAVADVFLPAGGRPYTVHGKNWKNFFTPEGAPSAKAVVEGANIFFTDEARKALQDRGVMMFKDSSANKCGVICSSFEILASLLWEPEEFVAFKESYVEEVLGKLRSWADLEAKLLLKEFKERGGQVNLVNLSRIVSETMNRVTDLVAAHLDPLTANDLQTSPYRDIILNYIPKTIRDRFPERIFERLPISYQKALVSAEVASTVVYREGVAWFEWMADEGVAQIVLSYMEKEQEILRLIEQLQESPLPEEVIHILRRSGARTLTLLNQSRSGQS